MDKYRQVYAQFIRKIIVQPLLCKRSMLFFQ